MEWMLMPLRRYAEFSGRSRRKEYWMYVLGIIIVSIVFSVIEAVLGWRNMVGPYGPLSAALLLGTFVPSLAVGVRRLHDIDRTGWWVVMPIVPEICALAFLYSGQVLAGVVAAIVALAAAITLLVFMITDGTSGPNRFGPDPKGAADAQVFA